MCVMFFSCINKNTPIEFDSGYFGIPLPGDTPELLAPGFISTDSTSEYGGHFSPDGRMFIFTRFSPGIEGQLQYTEYKDGTWSNPERVPFGLEDTQVESCFSPDGTKLYYVHIPPTTGEEISEFFHDIWVVDWTGSSWGVPKQLTSIDLGSRRICPSVANNGNLYYSGDYQKAGDKDIYCSRFINGSYTEPENLGNAVNSEYFEEHVYIAPDESYIIFDSYRPGLEGNTDNYISFRSENGIWTEARKLEGMVNTGGYDWYPSVTPDGKYILFSRNSNGQIDIYWVGAGIIDDMRGKQD